MNAAIAPLVGLTMARRAAKVCVSCYAVGIFQWLIKYVLAFAFVVFVVFRWCFRSECTKLCMRRRERVRGKQWWLRQQAQMHQHGRRQRMRQLHIWLEK